MVAILETSVILVSVFFLPSVIASNHDWLKPSLVAKALSHSDENSRWPFGPLSSSYDGCNERFPNAIQAHEWYQADHINQNLPEDCALVSMPSPSTVSMDIALPALPETFEIDESFLAPKHVEPDFNDIHWARDNNLAGFAPYDENEHIAEDFHNLVYSRCHEPIRVNISHLPQHTVHSFDTLTAGAAYSDEVDGFHCREHTHSYDSCERSDMVLRSQLRDTTAKIRTEAAMRRPAQWKRTLGSMLGKVYKSYAEICNCGLTKARLHLNLAANEQLAWLLLSPNDVERKKAATIISAQASQHYGLRQPCASKLLLGIDQIQASRAFCEATGKSYSTAWRHFNSAMTPEIAQMLLSPDTFDRGIQTLIFAYKNREPKKRERKDFALENDTGQQYRSSNWFMESRNTSEPLPELAMPPPKFDADWKEMLGPFAPEVAKIFRAATGRGYTTSSRYLQRNVTPEIAALINDPTTHDEAILSLITPYLQDPPRPGRVRGKVYLPAEKGTS